MFCFLWLIDCSITWLIVVAAVMVANGMFRTFRFGILIFDHSFFHCHLGAVSADRHKPFRESPVILRHVLFRLKHSSSKFIIFAPPHPIPLPTSIFHSFQNVLSDKLISAYMEGHSESLFCHQHFLFKIRWRRYFGYDWSPVGNTIGSSLLNGEHP